MNSRTTGLLGMAAFIVVTSGPEEGILVDNFSANGLFVAMITALLATKVYSIFIDKGITIKMPDSVPPQIGNSFGSILPYVAVLGVCWVIRTLLNGFDYEGKMVGTIELEMVKEDKVWKIDSLAKPRFEKLALPKKDSQPAGQ